MPSLLEGAVELLHPLLHVAWGVLSPPGAGRWYFLLALRLLAIVFARSVWRGPPHDLVCAWDPPVAPAPPPGLRRLCATLCYNQHFAAPMGALWSFSFLLALLPITVLRLLQPPARKEGGGEGAKMAAERRGEGGDVAAERGSAFHLAGERGGGGLCDAAAEDGGFELCNMAAEDGGDLPNMAAEHGGDLPNMAAERGASAVGGAAAGWRAEERRERGGGRGPGGKMAAGRERGEESAALMGAARFPAALRPRPGREAKMAAWQRPAAKDKMADGDHVTEDLKMANWSLPSGKFKMADEGHVTEDLRMANWSLPSANSKMADKSHVTKEPNGDDWSHPRAKFKMADEDRVTEDPNMAPWCHHIAKFKMADGDHVTEEAKMANWSLRSGKSKMADRDHVTKNPNMTAWCHPSAKSKMADGDHVTEDPNVAAWWPTTKSKMAACCLATNPKMAAEHHVTEDPAMAACSPYTPANRAARPRHVTAPPKMAARRCRACLQAVAVAILAAAEGGFLWAVLSCQLPTLTAAPIGCRPPGPAPCPPLACTLPAPADKMAALMGLAVSAAASLFAVMATAGVAANGVLRGRG